MRAVVLLVVSALARAQAPDPAYEPLARAYEALRARDYDAAIRSFLQAIEAAPNRASVRKDLAYAYLKVGENEQARELFREALRLEPGDTQTALEYAFLCNETRQKAEARRIFDRLRRDGNATAEQAFRNIEEPLAEGIRRWQEALTRGADNFSAHDELATLAEQRDHLELAAEHYEKAWRLEPNRRSVLVDLGRVWKQLNRGSPPGSDANAALLAASRGGETRAAEQARELLPDRYPYVYEFRRALELDPGNIELRRELGYLLLRMNRPADAEAEFRILAETPPGDLLSAAQLGLLLQARGEDSAAKPFFDRVLAGPDQGLANRVHDALQGSKALPSQRDGASGVVVDAKSMAERSLKAGYLPDALKYFTAAHEADPTDDRILLRLGWVSNMLHDDEEASRWFDLARRSSDRRIAAEAGRAWRNVRGATARFRTTAWLFPVFSTRWHDVFSYGQVKTEVRTGIRLRPYLSVRFIGDTRVRIGVASPQYLSESSFIVGGGVSTVPWHGITGWAEAGSAMSYVTGHFLPDYRGGVSVARSLGASLTGESAGWFLASTTDGVFLSRFGNDLLGYQQTRAGYTTGRSALRAQFYWNANLTLDAKRQGWANFIELGPGIRFRISRMPPSLFFMADLMRGAYLIHGGGPVATFQDVRVGFWYAFSW